MLTPKIKSPEESLQFALKEWAALAEQIGAINARIKSGKGLTPIALQELKQYEATLAEAWLAARAGLQPLFAAAYPPSQSAKERSSSSSESVSPRPSPSPVADGDALFRRARVNTVDPVTSPVKDRSVAFPGVVHAFGPAAHVNRVAPITTTRSRVI